MTSDNGNENTPRREAMTGRGDVDPLVHRHAQDAASAEPGTPADPAAYDPGEAPRRPADRATSSEDEAEAPSRGAAGDMGSRDTANPSRTTAGGAPGMRGEERATRDTRTGREEPTRTGIDEPTGMGKGDPSRPAQGDRMRAMQPDSARAGQGGDPTRAGQPESTRAGQGDRTRTGQGEPTRAGQRDAGPQGDGDGALLSHDECDKYSLRLQHAVGGFVDGPRASVEEADHVLEELTTEFTDAMTRRRRNLRTTWQAAGESDTADTEKLRLALRDYREVTERLLHL
ncbi:hypothetical protein ACIOHS_12200 [Streptomyces sp. NPDC088253]|uniref:hypothetical protein n=1 Tax=Streptomyces sp. NPDC088253 TaxID=3365846 RepID=UPI0038124629